jgi:hypothetical protein
LTGVYGPSTDSLKQAFLKELIELSQVHIGAWLLVGNINVIYHAKDKSNDHLNRHLMSQFHSFLSVAALKEIHL